MKASEYLEDELKKIGITKTYVDNFKIRPAFWSGTATFALVFSTAILLTINSIPIISFVLATLLPILVILEIDRGLEITMRTLPSSIGRNVIGIEPPANQAKQTVILCAHHDSKTQAIPIRFRGGMLVILLLGMVFLFVASVLEVLLTFVSPQLSFMKEPLTFGVAVVTTYYGIYAILNYITRFVVESPGAEDNAAGIGVILETAKKLKLTNLVNTEVWFLFTDAEEIAMKGANSFSRKYKDILKGAFVINIEGCGTDASLAYSTKEQSVMAKPTSAELIEILVEIAKSLGESIEPIGMKATTDGYQFARYGFDVVTLWRYDDESRDVAHTPHDTIEKIDPAALEKTVTLIDSVLRYLDRKIRN